MLGSVLRLKYSEQGVENSSDLKKTNNEDHDFWYSSDLTKFILQRFRLNAAENRWNCPCKRYDGNNTGYFNIWLCVRDELKTTSTWYSFFEGGWRSCRFTNPRRILPPPFTIIFYCSDVLGWIQHPGWSIRIKLMGKNSIREKYFTAIAWISDPASERYGDHKFRRE